MLTIVFILIIHLVIGLMIENIKRDVFTFPINLLLLVCSMLFTVGITYTADWSLYEWYYRYELELTDPVFFQLTKLFRSYHLEYDYLFMVHISSSILIYFFVISRYTKNYFYVFLIYLMLDYVHFTNQIRYYVGFPILMTGYYYLFYRKRYFISISLIVLGILCHAGLAALLLFIPLFYFVSTKNFTKVIMAGSLAMFIIIYFAMNGSLGLALQHYDAYFGKEYDSSIIGGFFNALPYVAYGVFFTIEFPRLLKKKVIVDKRKHDLLVKLSIFPFIFLPGALLTQILGHRFIMPFSIFWMITYLYLIRDLPEKKRFFKMLLFSVVHFFAIFAIYILPDFVLPQNLFKKEIELTIKSISYLKDLFF